jgi:hypothetical protein
VVGVVEPSHVGHDESNASFAALTFRPETCKLTSKMRRLHLNHRTTSRMVVIHLPSVLPSRILGSVGSKPPLAKLTPAGT